MNLRDAVSDLHPAPPPCFQNRVEWREYLWAATAAQNQKSEPKVILIKNGEPEFNYHYPYCDDCTQIKSVEMMAQDRCKPNFLKLMTV